MGMLYDQVSGALVSGLTDKLTGNPTELLYTAFVDIVSEKLNQFSNVRDGSSDSVSNKSLVCRLYLSDEVSISGNDATLGYAPIVIHRQFKNAKQVMWNKEAVIDWLDIEVLDQYGQLVPLPVVSFASSFPSTVPGSYPDFQITLLASEN